MKTEDDIPPETSHIETNDSKINAKIYPLYALDVTKAVTHILVVMNIIKDISKANRNITYVHPSEDNSNSSNYSQRKTIINTSLQRHKRKMLKNSTNESNNVSPVSSSMPTPEATLSGSSLTKSKSTSASSSLKTNNSTRSSKSNISSLTSDQYSSQSLKRSHKKHDSNDRLKRSNSPINRVADAPNSWMESTPWVGDTANISPSLPIDIIMNGMNMQNEINPEQYDFFDDDNDAIYGEGYDDVWNNPYSSNGHDRLEGASDGHTTDPGSGSNVEASNSNANINPRKERDDQPQNNNFVGQQDV